MTCKSRKALLYIKKLILKHWALAQDLTGLHVLRNTRKLREKVKMHHPCALYKVETSTLNIFCVFIFRCRNWKEAH